MSFLLALTPIFLVQVAYEVNLLEKAQFQKVVKNDNLTNKKRDSQKMTATITRDSSIFPSLGLRVLEIFWDKTGGY